METDESDAPSYQGKQRDNKLDKHEGRITRLERGGLLVFGYLLAEGSDLLTDISTFF